jgi:unsaturated chondroitin disaccharide hydrolase
LQVVPTVSLRPEIGSLVWGLPGGAWDVSFDVRVSPGARLAVGVGNGSALAGFVGRRGRAPAVVDAGHKYTRVVRPGWLARGSVHVEATRTRLSVDGRALPRAGASGGGGAGPLVFTIVGGRAVVSGLIVSAASNRGALLLHRVAELHARVPARRFPLGSTVGDRISYADHYWTSGFYAGALWQAAALAPGGAARRMFTSWALRATVAHLGQERRPTHDLGFMYGESSLAAWRAVCSGHVAAARTSVCARLKRSVLAAAGELVALERDNAAAGTIPTNPTSGDTIIDSMMNIAVLPWASRESGNPVYAQVARRHASRVASLLVRPDGSTAQSVNFDRATGQVLFVSTHQGLSDSSTWSRGQGWAVYGFSVAATQLHSASFLRVALRAARYVAAHLPAGGVPLWDYDAGPGAPVDVSAGMITAAGLFHLASACRSFPGVCSTPARWRALGKRMLADALTRADAQPPLGLLRDQILNERSCGCAGSELIFGITYGLEAENLSEAVR